MGSMSEKLGGCLGNSRLSLIVIDAQNGSKSLFGQQRHGSRTLHSECTTIKRFIQQAYDLDVNGSMNPLCSGHANRGPAFLVIDHVERLSVS
jgi:hypothetical protein